MTVTTTTRRRLMKALDKFGPQAQRRSELVECVRVAKEIVEEALGTPSMDSHDEPYRGAAYKLVLDELLTYEVDDG